MQTVFPDPIQQLPEANIPIPGVRAYLSQGDGHQVLFMEFSQDAEPPEHAHEAQFSVVTEGKIELCIGGVSHTFSKGDRYYIPRDTKHAGKIYAGYADITFFGENDRYKIKEK